MVFFLIVRYSYLSFYVKLDIFEIPKTILFLAYQKSFFSWFSKFCRVKLGWFQEWVQEKVKNYNLGWSKIGIKKWILKIKSCLNGTSLFL